MSLVCSLLVAERPAPPRELLVPQAEVTARSLRLQWVPGSDGASPIRYFTVQVRELPRGEWQTYSSSVSHEATACAVERYPAPGTPSPGDGAWSLGGPEMHPDSSCLLLVHTPCTRNQDFHLREPTLASALGLSFRARPVWVVCTPQVPGMDEAQMTGPESLEVWAPAPYPLRGTGGGGGAWGKGVGG